MPNLGAPEIIIIVVVLVLLLGWKKLPDAARSVGRSMRIFKSEVSEMKNDGQSAASKDTVDGQATRQPGATTPQTTTPPAVQENAPRTDNTSGSQNPTGTPGSTSI